MSYFVIGGEDIVLGFSYAGVPGQVVTGPAEASAALARACTDSNVHVVIIEDRLAEGIREEVNRVLFGSHRTVVVEVPGLKGPSANRPDLLKLIREAVGIKL